MIQVQKIVITRGKEKRVGNVKKVSSIKKEIYHTNREFFYSDLFFFPKNTRVPLYSVAFFWMGSYDIQISQPTTEYLFFSSNFLYVASLKALSLSHAFFFFVLNNSSSSTY